MPAAGAKADRRSAKYMALDAEVLSSLSLQLKEEGNEIASRKPDEVSNFGFDIWAEQLSIVLSVDGAHSRLM